MDNGCVRGPAGGAKPSFVRLVAVRRPVDSQASLRLEWGHVRRAFPKQPAAQLTPGQSGFLGVIPLRNLKTIFHLQSLKHFEAELAVILLLR